MKTYRRVLALCLALALLVAAGCGESTSRRDEEERRDPANTTRPIEDVQQPNASDNNAGATDPLVVAIDPPEGLFNPFFATAASDGTVVSMTQIPLLSYTYNEATNVMEPVWGDKEATVAQDFQITENPDGTVTYTFVLKNGILFSDGHPLTMEDVLFNYYVCYDPMYNSGNAVKILGLNEYHTQSATGNAADNRTYQQAASMADARIMELINLFNSAKKASPYGEVTYEDMKQAILNYTPSSAYKSAVSANPGEVTNRQVLADYEYVLALVKEELDRDFEDAKTSFTEATYASFLEFQDPIFRFMYYEGYVNVKFVEGDRTKIQSLTPHYPTTALKTKEDAIEYVYQNEIATNLTAVLTVWDIAAELTNEYTAEAVRRLTGGKMTIPTISGIVSLGHTNRAGETITIGDKSYKVATAHNADGTVKKADEYDVLQITIVKADPSALSKLTIYVAPQHYYGEGSKVGVDIANNQFGVEYASFDFMKNVIRSTRNVKLPMGAGPYKATDGAGSDTPAEDAFYKDNVVYFKRNEHFHTVGEEVENAKIANLQYRVVADAVAALESGDVHFATPAVTEVNFGKLNELKSAGMVSLVVDHLGYGYIGVNAAKVQDINLRKAIMCAMNTSLALDYYRAGTASQIYWPMSKVSWAYPDGIDAYNNGKDYPAVGKFDKDNARALIERYMKQANVSAGSTKLKVQFTIAGSSLTDHPTYKVFRDAAALLNGMGWQVEVVCDPQALTKINTGSLAVWAAAWSAAYDPDMYKVYHKDSTATATLAWGYPYLKQNGTYEEKALLNELSKLIEQARAITDQSVRADLYQEAMGYVLDLAIELPVYQRSVMYAYNSNVIKTSSLPEVIHPFASPLYRIWEVEFAN